MTRTAGAPIGCQRPSRFWGLGCPKIYHEVEDTLENRYYDAKPQQPQPAASALGYFHSRHLTGWHRNKGNKDCSA
ncbi:hypothetical protein, partial [Thiolapillus sp.]|uniref:hypothetical protein n=1 Tax=Thiolapillus sp. TaxID=2017437 RepID=UPI003AF4B15D